MALSDSSRAIGAVARLLRDRLQGETGVDVTVGPPEETNALPAPRFNLFLYEAIFDGPMKNVTLVEGQPPPLWLVLRFLLTPFDENGRTDTLSALRTLGSGVRVLQQHARLLLTGLAGQDMAALLPNPEPLKISFNEASSDLIAKLTQTDDRPYRFSLAFEVRPVMICSGEVGGSALLVGVDYSVNPPAVIGEHGLGLEVRPTMGARVERVDPEIVSLGQQFTVTGSDFSAQIISAAFGRVELPVAALLGPTQLRALADPALLDGGSISAGLHPLSVIEALPSGRRRTSNFVPIMLRPRLDAIAPALALDPLSAQPRFVGSIDLDGRLLGTDTDEINVAVNRDGVTVRSFEDVVALAGPPQTRKQVIVPSSRGIPPGTYRLILTVNGAQATLSPQLVLP